MKNTLVLAAVVTAAGISFGASANAATSTHAGKNDCVFTSAIHDFRPLDRNKVVIYGPGRKAYLVELSMPMPELKFANRLAFVDRNHDGMLCGYGMDRIVVADSGFGFRTPSTILGMQRLDDAGIAQLEEQYDVRLTRKKKAPAVAQPQAGSAQPQEAAQQPEAVKEND
jgi:Family of unknown function (DUF6491)